MSECRNCHAEILWARTENDKKIPIDPQPSPNGKFYLGGDDSFPTASFVHDNERKGMELYSSHFDTCKKAKPKGDIPPTPATAPLDGHIALRDIFAAMALVPLIERANTTEKQAAEAAYLFADAMLEMRKSPTKP